MDEYKRTHYSDSGGNRPRSLCRSLVNVEGVPSVDLQTLHAGRRRRRHFTSGESAQHSNWKEPSCPVWELVGDLRLPTISYWTFSNMRKKGGPWTWTLNGWRSRTPMTFLLNQRTEREGPPAHLQNEGAFKGLNNKMDSRRCGSRLHSALNIHMLNNSWELLRVANNLILFFQRTPGRLLTAAGMEGRLGSGEATGLWRSWRDCFVARKQLYSYKCGYFYQVILTYPFVAISMVA